jgi:hypothetical protein
MMAGRPMFELPTACRGHGGVIKAPGQQSGETGKK